MSDDQLPALSLVAVPGRRRATVELARAIEQRGFPAIFAPSLFGNISLCEALAWNTERVLFGSMISPIYARTASDFAQLGAFLHEVSGGRFLLGIGVSHAPAHMRMGVVPGKPLGDVRAFMQRLRAQEGLGPLPPVVLAALRTRMVALAGEIAQGVVFANAALSHMSSSLAALPPERRDEVSFFIGNMIPTCVAEDVQAAKAVNRRSLLPYALLPNYRNYWKEAGYVEEMEAIERAIVEERREDVPKYLTDRWLADVSLFGSPANIRDGVAAWRAAGVRTPILVPSSAAGNQFKAMEELFAAFAM